MIFCFLSLFLALIKNSTTHDIQIDIIYPEFLYDHNIEKPQEYQTRSVKIDIYQPSFFLNEKARINTTFMLGTAQKVIYLNYPFTFSNDHPTKAFKNTNSSGLIILQDQPQNMTTANFSLQKIEPIAYFTLQENQTGWQLFSPSEYYSKAKIPTKISCYNNNIYLGKTVGPQEKSNNNFPLKSKYREHANFVNNYYDNLANFYVNLGTSYKNTLEISTIENNIEKKHLSSDQNIQNLIRYGSSGNVIIGSNSGTFEDSRYISFNIVLGTQSGNYLTGSCNTFIGNFNGSHNEISVIILNDDYYSANKQSNYNNAVGFANLNLSNQLQGNASGRLIAIKQNNIFGNFNCYSMKNCFRNIVIGNRNLSTIIDNSIQFNYIDTNILIGNNILFATNTQPMVGMYGNIMLIPNGDDLLHGGLGITSALSGSTSNWGSCNNAIFIGSCGLPIPYERSYKTFISNIYNDPLFSNTIFIENILKKTNEQGLSSPPIVAMVNNADEIGNMAMVPYGSPNPDSKFGTECPSNTTSSYYKCQPGNVFNIDNAVSSLLDPISMPIMGIAFENTKEASKDKLYFTVDTYSMINNATDLTKKNLLSEFIIYNIIRQVPPYLNANEVDGETYLISNPITIAGYEHYYLIPLIVKALQNINQKITIIEDNLKIGQSEITKNIILKKSDYNESNEELKERIDIILENYNKLISIIDEQNNKIKFLEEYIYKQDLKI